MAAFVSTDITVALAQRDIIPLGMSKKMTFPSITFGDGAITYHDTTKVPMPAIGNFGFKKAIERVQIDNPGNGYIYSFDRANHRIRIWLGAARDAITVANHVGVAPTGNVAAPVFTGDALANITPAGNLANLAAGAFTGDALANITPTGNLANLAAAAHSHDLVVAANSQGDEDVTVGINTGNTSLVANSANAITIVGGNVTTGGIANTTPGNGTGDFVGDSIAPGTPSGNVANGTGDFVGDPIAPGTPAGNCSAPAFSGDAPANFVHVVTGGGAVAEAPLAEMDTGVAPAAVTLYTTMIGQ